MAVNLIPLIIGLVAPIVLALVFAIPLFRTLDRLEGVSYRNMITSIRVFASVALFIIAYFWWRLFYELKPFLFEDLGIWIDLIALVLVVITFLFMVGLVDQMKEIEKKAYK